MRRSLLSSTLMGLFVVSSLFTASTFRKVPNPQGPRSTGSSACQWLRVPTPNANPRRFQDELVATLALGPHDVWASGDAAEPKEGGEFRSFMLHWNGARWGSVSLPIKRRHGFVTDLAATSPSDVWAVTDHAIEHWDGHRWTVVPAEAPGVHSWRLAAISAIGPTDAWAVGLTSANRSSATLTEHWDGTAWTIVPSPNPPPSPLSSHPSDILSAVDAVSTNDVWAAGTSINLFPLGASTTLIEHWDGASWSVVPSPNLPGRNGIPFDTLWSIAAPGPSEAWAVGSAGGFVNGRSEPLIAHWDGVAWSLSKGPRIRGSSVLFSVTGSVDHGLRAAGTTVRGTIPPTHPVILRWDGTRWVREPIPERGWNIQSVSDDGAGSAWAVGASTAPNGWPRTLSLHCSPTEG